MTKTGISFNFSALAKRKWYEFAIRFLFGGAVTVGAGLLAKKYGPSVGGLFLAFPAIFPAGITLVEKNEREKKGKAGMDGTDRGRKAAALDAAGAAMGSLALVGFGFVVHSWLPHGNAGFVLLAASVTWFALSVAIWMLRKKLRWF